MLTGKQKHYLRGLAQTTKPLFQLGKNGLSEAYFEQIEEAIEKRELIKINLLQTTEVTVDELANFLKQHDNRIEIAQKLAGHWSFIRHHVKKNTKKFQRLLLSSDVNKAVMRCKMQH